MLKVYISGPIAGNNDYVSDFADAQEELTNLGYEAVNPVTIWMKYQNEIGRIPSYDETLARDLEVLATCDHIYLLDGWEKSNGARVEWNKAKELGIQPIYLY